MFDSQTLFFLITFVVAILVSSIVVIFSSAKAALLSAFLVMVLAISYKYPRFGLWAFLVYLPFGGTVSYSVAAIYEAVGGKIAFTSEYSLFQLAKDAFYLPALLAIVISGNFWQWIRRPFLKPLVFAVSCLIAIAFINYLFINGSQQLNPQGYDKPLLMGIIGFKILLGYIPLLFCAHYLISDRPKLLFFIRLQLIIILVCCGLCFIQYLLLVNGVCAGSAGLPEPASYRTSLQARCFVGGSLLYNPEKGLIRLPGTFVAPWQWGWFLISSTFFAYAATISDPEPKWRWIGLTGVIFLLITSLISGQRISLLLVPVILIILLVINEKSKKKLGIIGGVILAISIIGSSLPFIQQRIANFIERWNYSPPTEFVVKQFAWVIKEQDGILGHGLGRTASAARRLGKVDLVEVFHGQLLYEMGPLGLIIFLALVTVICYLTYKSYRAIQDKSWRRFGLTLWFFVLFISYNIYYYPLAVDPVAVYYWFFAGVILQLPELEKETKLIITKEIIGDGEKKL